VALTAHDILTDARLFKLAYPSWPSVAPANPLDGPFLTSRQLTDYSDDPSFAIPMRSACRHCREHITLLGGEWTTGDGTTACTDTSAPFVPHKPQEG
jgi:hypothetical protein